MRAGRGKGRRDWRKIGLDEKSLKITIFEHFIGFLLNLIIYYRTYALEVQNQANIDNDVKGVIYTAEDSLLLILGSTA
jgi:hypothetical protein